MRKFPYSVIIDQSIKKLKPHNSLEWQEECTNTFNSISINTESPDVVSMHKFQKGEKAHLIWVEASFGDSLGTSSKREVMSIALLKNEFDAKALIGALNKELKKGFEAKEKFSFYTSEGEHICFESPVWSSYFSKIDQINHTIVTF